MKNTLRNTIICLLIFMSFLYEVGAENARDFQPMSIDFEHMEKVEAGEEFSIMKSRFSIQINMPGREGLITKKYNMVGKNPTIVDVKETINNKEVALKDIFVARVKAEDGKNAECHLIYSPSLTSEGFVKPYMLYKGKKIMGPIYRYSTYFDEIKDSVVADKKSKKDDKNPEKENIKKDSNKDETKQVEDLKTEFQLMILGKNIDLSKEMGSPYIKDGRTMVPIRLISESLGYDVKWEQKTKTVAVIDKSMGKDLTFKVGSQLVNLNGKEVPIEAKDALLVPEIVGGRTYLPLRFIVEAMGLNVAYKRDNGKHIIKIYQ